MSFTAEGVLKEALVRLWEQARAKKVESIRVLTLRMFEAGDAFQLLGAVGAVSGADKSVRISGDYETREGGSFELEFSRAGTGRPTGEGIFGTPASGRKFQEH